MTEVYVCNNPDRVEDVRSRNDGKIEFTRTKMVATDISSKWADFPILGTEGDCAIASFGLGLKVENLKADEHHWSYTRFTLFKNGQELCQIYRNYHAGPFAFVKHPNGKMYFVCGFDYQGMTVVNLDDERVAHYLPESAFKGNGWCMATIKRFNSEEKTLTVDGCYWGATYDRLVFDFEDPESLPWKVVRDETEEYCKEWPDDEDEDEENGSEEV